MARCSKFLGIGAVTHEICRIMIDRELIKTYLISLPPPGRYWIQPGHCHLYSKAKLHTP